MKTAAFIIRFHYAETDPRFEWRFNYFKTEVLPRILAQTDKNFDICIRCNPAHEEKFKKLAEEFGFADRLKTFQVKNNTINYKKGSNNKVYFEDFVQWEDVIGLPKYDIQMGLDSDDLIDEHYVSIIKDKVKKAKGSLHISFQPTLYRLKNKRYTAMMAYGPTRGSAFLALYQPNKEDYKFVYCRSHISMWRVADETITIRAGHCSATAHHLNESTGK